MKKIDKLVLSAFLGPFVLTYLVVNFILLTVKMLQYFDDLIGKGLGWDVLGTFLFYLTVLLTPGALPLAVLLASLIAFGNLGEHFELTAVKSLGISLVRSLQPIFLFSIVLTGVAFIANNYLVPSAALEAYSLLHDIKQKKPALDLREGTFFNGIPDISIKADHKFPDGITLKDITIYDHRNRSGNKEVIKADSGRMFTFHQDQYLKMELFRGYNYSEGTASGTDMAGNPASGETFNKTRFHRSEFVFDLSSFDLKRTEKQLFQGNRIMRNMAQLEHDIDSISFDITRQRVGIYASLDQMFSYHLKRDSVLWPPDLEKARQQRDSLQQQALIAGRAVRYQDPPSFLPEVRVSAFVRNLPDTVTAYHRKKADSLFAPPYTVQEISSALGQVRLLKSQLLSYNTNIDMYGRTFREFSLQWHKIIANSLACLVMFLIGAPLGAIIKKGGLGVPVLLSIIFYIIYYVLGILGDKWAKNDFIPVLVGVWAPNIILLALGLFFLRQARVDARLFDADFYRVMWDRLQGRFHKKPE